MKRQGILKKRLSRKRFNNSGNELCPICNEKHILIEHHIHGRTIPDFKKSWNIASICSNCHRLIHEGEIIIEDWLYTSEGRQLSFHRKNEKGIIGKDSLPFIIQRN